MRKLFIYLFLLLLMINISFGYKVYNSSLENMVLDSNGWCTDLEINFRVYNETEYLDKTNINNNLCVGNETPEEDYCEVFQVLQPDIKIYDGPAEWMPILYESKADINSEFKYTFINENQYFIEMTGLDNYNDYFGQLFDVFICKKSESMSQENIVVENKVVDLYNVSFDYSGLKIDLKNTDMNVSSNLTVRNSLSFNDLNIGEINNSINLFEISSLGNTFSYLEINVPIVYENKSNLKLYIYDNNLKTWNQISNFVVLNNNLIITSATMGIYSVVEEEPVVVQEIVEESISNEVIVEENVNDVVNPIKKSSNNYLYIFIIVLIICIVTVYFIKKDKTLINSLNVSNIVVSTPIKSSETPEVLNSYNQIYEHTKEYVHKYKNNYSKDEIFRSLKNANVPKDMIDKIFEEEY